MSKYNLDLDYVIEEVDISKDELNEIIAEADRIIAANMESREKLAEAYLKKAQCLLKLETIQKQNMIREIGIFRYWKYFKKKPLLKNRLKFRMVIEKALELSPDMPEALLQLGSSYFTEYKFESPLTQEIKIICRKKENWKRAIDFYTKAIQLKPDYAAAFYNRGIAYSSYYIKINYRSRDGGYYSHRLDGGFYRNYSTNTPGNIVRENEGRVESYNNGDKVIADRTELVKSYNYANKAIADYTDAIRLKPDFAACYQDRAEQYGDLGEHEKAIADYSELIRIGPNSLEDVFHIFYNRGRRYSEVKNYEKTIADLTEAIRLRQNHYEALIHRGNAYFNTYEYDKAINDFLEAIQICSNNPGTMEYLWLDTATTSCVKTCWLKGEHEKAIAVLTNTIEIMPNQSGIGLLRDMFLSARGDAHWLTGDYDKAIADYSEAIKPWPGYALGYYRRSKAYQLKGEYEKAEADMAEFRRFKADFPEIFPHCTDFFGYNLEDEAEKN